MSRQVPIDRDKAAVRAACPQTADWINGVVAVFGNLRAIEVRNRQGCVIYRAGRFDVEPEGTEFCMFGYARRHGIPSAGSAENPQ